MPDSEKKRRLKKKYRGDSTVRLRLENRRLKARVKELEERLYGGWKSVCGTYCDTRYAARMLNKSEGTLRNLRSQGLGPKVYARSGSIYYKLAHIYEYIDEGIGARHEEEE